MAKGMTSVCSECGEVYWTVQGHTCDKRRA